jgi:hypothetical protein
MKVVSAICSQTVGGLGLPGRSCTADFGAGLMRRDSILFASIFKLTVASGWPQGRLGKTYDCSKNLFDSFILSSNEVVILYP